MNLFEYSSENFNLIRSARRTMVAFLRRRLAALAWRLIALLHWLIRFTPDGRAHFYPVSRLAWARPLEADWRLVRAELDAVMVKLHEVPNAQDAYAGQEALATDDQWKTFTLCRGSNKFVDNNCSRCPHTHRLLRQVPGLTHAMFSILAPGKHIQAHRGAYGGLIDCHLALLVPEPAERCRIRVGDEERQWQEGKLLAFDDSHEHEVWNDTTGLRAVLLMYVVRPLPFPLASLNLAVMRIVSRVI
jgi:ornithine lipid ester-linked acyl 2-hydroxylase